MLKQSTRNTDERENDAGRQVLTAADRLGRESMAR